MIHVCVYECVMDVCYVVFSPPRTFVCFVQ